MGKLLKKVRLRLAVLFILQALLEMSDLESAEAMVQYYSERPPRVGSHTVLVRFSNYEELKTESSPQVDLCTCLHCFPCTLETLKCSL